jgi:adenylate cyclase
VADPGGICVSGAAHDHVRSKLDVGFEDLGERKVKNLSTPIRVWCVRANRPAIATNHNGGETDAIVHRSAVAVLPFINLSGDPEQEHVADGLTEDIITLLSHFRSFPVVARNSTFSYKGRSRDLRRVGEELSARYLV